MLPVTYFDTSNIKKHKHISLKICGDVYFNHTLAMALQISCWLKSQFENMVVKNSQSR